MMKDKGQGGDVASEEKPVLTKEDVEQLLGRPVLQADIKNLTAAGDNYGSLMVAVDVVMASGETVELVAKKFPKSEFARKLFKSSVSMKKEIDMYVLVSPEFDRIQEEAAIPDSQRLRVLCGCPGARLALEELGGDQEADENSVLLLENLKVKGYRTGERGSGLDLKHAEFALKHLARFHATAVAIKLKKPQIFKSTILRACNPFKMTPKTRKEEIESQTIFFDKLQKIPVCKRHLDKIESIFKKGVDHAYSDHFPKPAEPFATILHNDFWTNNMMFRYSDEASNEPIDFKIVDFQTSMYESPVYDILLFLFTSTHIGIVEDKFDHMLKLYHDCFTEWLQKLGCDVREFSFDRFLKETDAKAPESLDKIMFMLKPITLTKKDTEKFTDGPNFDLLDLNENYVTRVTSVVNIYAKKGWL